MITISVMVTWEHVLVRGNAVASIVIEAVGKYRAGNP